MEKTKPFIISKQLFVEAYKEVKANAGAAGIDQESLSDFEKNLKDNLYKLWNHMSSGTYFPPPVMAVPIPKKSGGVRLLGIPTIRDRVCQTVVKLVFESRVEPYFLPDSYGYRPNKSALDAVGVTRQRCWEHNWVLEFDIKGLFDNIPHDLLMKAVHKHTEEKWLLLYIERWLKAPMQQKDGTLTPRSCGTPQGGVVSPVLSNLFLHYVFDMWMSYNHRGTPWCRYADDGLLHCKTLEQAQQLLEELKKRFKECGLELHPEKTKIVYCKDGKRKGKYPNKSFDFLGYTFRSRRCENRRDKSLFYSFTPAVSKIAQKSMRATIRKLNLRNRADLSLEDIARWLNPLLQGWLNYYGRYARSEMYKVWRHFNRTLVAWAMKKYRSFHKRRIKAGCFLETTSKKSPNLFLHWRIGMPGAFA